MIRGFQEVAREHRKNTNVTQLPTRSDPRSAGYDFYFKCDEFEQDLILEPYESYTVWTDVKAYMPDDEVLQLYVRSSLGSQGIQLKNTVGIIDSSYFENPKNDGNIGIMLFNHNDHSVTIEKGSRIAQGIFMKYLTADGDETLSTKREGGFGSSGR